MNAADLAPGWGLAVLVLALIGVALFLVAIWTGRWGVWVAGYLMVVLAVAAAVMGQYLGEPDTASPAEPAVAQPAPDHPKQPRQDRQAGGTSDWRQPTEAP